MRWSLALVLVGCTTYTPPTDGVDAPANRDGATESTLTCAADFVIIPNGQPGHLYKVDPTQRDWETQVALCIFDGGYLAIPDTGQERQGLFAAINSPWVGVDDRTTEGTFIDSKQNLFTNPVASNTVDSDCVAIVDLQSLEAGPCQLPLPAVCECEP